MGQKVIIILLVVISIGLTGLCVYSYFQYNDIKLKQSDSKILVAKMKSDADSFKQEKEGLLKEIDELQEKSVAFAKLVGQGQEDFNKAKTELQNKQIQVDQKDIKIKELDDNIKILKENIIQVQKAALNEEITKVNSQLKEKIITLEKTFQKERSIHYYNLGVVYTKAGLLYESIDSYKQSLKYNFFTPQTHFNLGLLYDSFLNQPELAASHYRKYLEMAPDAYDREEVKKIIDTLIVRMIQ